jgi:hypothetical protein
MKKTSSVIADETYQAFEIKNQSKVLKRFDADFFALRGAVNCISTDETRYVLNHLFITTREGHGRVAVATDGRRMRITKLGERFDSLSEGLYLVTQKSQYKITLRKQIEEHKYPNYEQVIPVDTEKIGDVRPENAHQFCCIAGVYVDGRLLSTGLYGMVCEGETVSVSIEPSGHKTYSLSAVKFEAGNSIFVLMPIRFTNGEFDSAREFYNSKHNLKLMVPSV